MTTTTPSPAEATTQYPAAPVQPVAAPAQTLSILSLVFGLASIVLGLGFFASVAAVVLGAIAWNREPNGHTLSLIGIISGALGLIGGVLFGIIGLAVALPFLGALPFLPFW